MSLGEPGAQRLALGRGTHDSTLLGVALSPTGRIVERWAIRDDLGMLRPLGALR